MKTVVKWKQSIYWLAIILIQLIFANPNLANKTPEIRWQQQVDYEIAVTLDDEKHFLNGSEIITYHNNSPDDLHEIWLHIYPNAYKNETTAYAAQERSWGEWDFESSTAKQRGWIEVENLQINGEFAEFVIPENAIDQMKIILGNPLKAGETLQIFLDFEVKIPNIFSRLGHNGQHYEITQWFPKCAVYDNLCWHNFSYLDQGEFYSDFGNYDVSITLPKNYRVGATGILQTQSEIAFLDSLAQLDENAEFQNNQNTIKTVCYKAEQVHDFAWFADKNYIVRKYEFHPKTIKNSVDIWVFNLPKNKRVWRDAPIFSHDALDFYSRWYGDYPYSQMTVVDGDLNAGGGMEYPNITVVSTSSSADMLEMVIMHEIGHQWFYGILANNERDEAWLDEGINSFSEHRYWNEKYGKNDPLWILPNETDLPFDVPIFSQITHKYMQDMSYFYQAVRNADQPINLESSEFEWLNYSGIVYSKSAIILTVLQQYLGEVKFDRAMRQFYETWKFRHPRTADFREIIESVAGEKLDWFFDDLLQTTKKIDLAISDFSVKSSADGFVTTVKIENRGDIEMPTEIAVFSGEKQLASAWAFPEKIVEFFTQIEPNRAQLDPQNLLPDMNKLNNYSELPPIDFCFFVALPEQDKFQIFHSPVFDYGKFDGFRLGWKFSRKSIFMLPHNFLISANYGIESDQMNYELNYSNTKFLGRPRSLDYGISTSQNYGCVRKHSGFLAMEFAQKFDDAPFYSLDLNVGFLNLKNTNSDWFDNKKWDLMNYYYLETKEEFFTHFQLATIGAKFNYRIGFLDENPFQRFNFDVKFEQYLWKEFYGESQFSFSGLTNSAFAPKQEQIFLGGGIDPTFSDDFAGYDRSAENNALFLVEDGPSLLGFGENNESGTIGFSMRNFLTLPFSEPFTMKIFYELGNVAETELDLLKNWKSDAGFSVHFSEIVDFYFPIWVSKSSENSPKLDFRWRMQITLPTGPESFGF